MNWRHWFKPGRLARDEREQDIEREIRGHLELEAEDQRDAGMTAEDARYAAKRTFGNRTLVSEDIRAIWGTPSLDALLQDLRYAVRTMRRAPGFAAIAVGSSALGIGACSLIFAILNFAVLKPLPVDEPGRLLSLSEIDRRTGEAGSVLSYPDFRDLLQARSFEGIAASNPWLPASIGSQGDPQRHWGALVTANYFAVVKPGFAAGRGFDPGRDDIPGEPPVVVLSHSLWQTRFGGDPAIVGRTVSINKRVATVIGVTEARFRGTDLGIDSEFWIPFSMIDEIGPRSGAIGANRRRYWLSAVARLRAGVDVQAARAELDVMARTLNSTYARDESRGFHLEQAGQINPGLRRMALTLFSLFLGATLLVLLTACANVANLLLGRASARRREIAARMALGAGRGRLLRQLLTESLVLSLLGGAGGWIIAAYGASLTGLVRIPLGRPLDLSISLDYRVLLFCIGLSLATGVVFGLVPALRATRPDLVTDLKADGRGNAGVNRFGLRNGLVVAQMAICTLLLLSTGLFLRSLQTARGIDVGLSNRNMLLLAFDPALDHRPDPQARQLLRDILDQAHAVPGVESATLTTGVPLTFVIDNSRFTPEESAADPQRPLIGADIYGIGPGFFETMGISFLAGDVFRFDQGATGGIAIVNDAFARAAFPNQSAIGRRIVGDGMRLQIVGVAATAKSRTIGEAPRPSVFLPILNDYSAATRRGVTLVVKTRDAAATYAGPMREAIRRADPSLAVFDVRTMESHLSDALLVPRLAGVLSAIVGGIGLAIATIGVYGVISFAVARRRREIGIRLAVGARPREVLMMILKQGLTLAFTGTAVGFFAALGVTRFAASLLYSVNPTDPMTFVVVPSLLMAVALLACLVPARAAARLDPVDVLRSE
jgi:putative ABC transport system permease protein